MFNPRDHYWRAEDGRVFSSARAVLVTPDDAGLAAFTGSGNYPSVWPRDEAGAQTEATLQAVLTPYGLFVDLKAYAAAKRYEVETSGVEVAGARIATDRESQAMVTGALALAQAKPDIVLKFKASGTFVDLDAAAIQVVALAVGQHVQACFAKEAEVVAGIVASKPTITSRDQVDAAFAPLVAG